MNFPKYGELPMNIKRPTGEFDKNSKITVDVMPEHAILNLDGKKFEIQAESYGFDNDLNPEDVYKPDYKPNIESFIPEGIRLYRESLRSIDDKPIDDIASKEIINHFRDYFESQGLKVKVE